jgi:hypothetical protein
MNSTQQRSFVIPPQEDALSILLYYTEKEEVEETTIRRQSSIFVKGHHSEYIYCRKQIRAQIQEERQSTILDPF